MCVVTCSVQEFYSVARSALVGANSVWKYKAWLHFKVGEGKRVL